MAIHKKCHFSQASLWLQLCHFPSSLHSESGTVIKGSRRQTSEVSGETACWENLARWFSLSLNQADKCKENAIYMKTVISLQIKFHDSQAGSVLLQQCFWGCEILHFQYSDIWDTTTQGVACVKNACNLHQPKDTKMVLSPQLHPYSMLHPRLISPTLSRALPVELELPETTAPSSGSQKFFWMGQGCTGISEMTSALPF